MHEWYVSEILLSTTFTGDEIAAASWLELVPDLRSDYPRPDEDGRGYRAATYDLTNWCETCGVGAKQKAPFPMRGEPTWGCSSVLQLSQVLDEVFVTPRLWATVFEPAGVGCRPVVNVGGEQLATVVQLVVDETVGIVTADLTALRCLRCGRARYVPPGPGPFPALRSSPTSSMVRTAEYFAGGEQATNRVLVSQAIARSLDDPAVSGASLRPARHFDEIAQLRQQRVGGAKGRIPVAGTWS